MTADTKIVITFISFCTVLTVGSMLIVFYWNCQWSYLTLLTSYREAQATNQYLNRRVEKMGDYIAKNCGTDALLDEDDLDDDDDVDPVVEESRRACEEDEDEENIQ